MSESEKGFGHINRCIPLTKGLVKKKFHVEFLINKNKNIEKILDYENIPYRIIPKKVSIDNESKYIKKIEIANENQVNAYFKWLFDKFAEIFFGLGIFVVFESLR